MKKEIKGFVLGVLSTVVVGSGVALAAGQLTSIEVYPNNVKIYVRGQETDIPSFTYNDSTYVQLRPVLESIDCVINWDAENNAVYTYNMYEPSWKPAQLENNMKQYKLLIDMESSPAKAYIDWDILTDLGVVYNPDVQDAFSFFVPLSY